MDAGLRGYLVGEAQVSENTVDLSSTAEMQQRQM